MSTLAASLNFSATLEREDPRTVLTIMASPKMADNAALVRRIQIVARDTKDSSAHREFHSSITRAA